MLTAIVLILFIAVTPYEWFAVLRKEEKKVKIIYLSIMLVSFIILVLQSVNVFVPSPADFITNVIESIFSLQS